MLRYLFITISKVRVLQIRFQLQYLKKLATPIEEYIFKIRSLTDLLNSVGHFIADDKLILYILGGLGQEYEFVVVNLTSRHDFLSL